MERMSLMLMSFIICGGLLIRSALYYQSYSGEATPPMYGDFEAQRHWQEITVNIPIKDWYENTTDNDLTYWGLDYPPLSAYHSYAVGKVASFLNESYIKLHESRGITTNSHKTFMRTTVLLADLLLYIPIIIATCLAINKKLFNNYKNSNILLLCHIIIGVYYPGQILIDNGHFQYNNISLGLTALSICFLFYERINIASIFFVCALNYKQMELYHSMPFFFYMLADCFTFDDKNQKLQNCIKGFKRLLSLATFVIGSFLIIYLPWLFSLASLKQIIHRLFPVARGVFEDKVANVWCIANVFVKLRDKFTNEQMFNICAACTLIVALPVCLHLLLNKRKEIFLLAQINCSLAFFLFSFQVHEKSILLVALPVILYFPCDPLPCFWLLQITTFSVLPLYEKDKLLLTFIALTIFFNALIIFLVKLFNFSRIIQWNNNGLNTFLSKLFLLSMFFSLILMCCYFFILPPKHLPHLHQLLISAYSCGHFLLFLIYFIIKQIMFVYNERNKIKLF